MTKQFAKPCISNVDFSDYKAKTKNLDVYIFWED